MQINLIINVKYAFAILLLSLIFVLISVFIPVEINNKKDQSNVELGLPLKFLKQDQTRLDPYFPVKVNIGSPWESSFRISWTNFFLSIVIVFIVVYLIFIISVNLFKRLPY